MIDEGNLIDERFAYALDYEWFLRLAEKGYKFKHVPQLLGDYRWHSSSISCSQAAKQHQEVDQIAQIYSPILRRLPAGLCRRAGLHALRSLAAIRRYSEKLLRGHYSANSVRQLFLKCNRFLSYKPRNARSRQHDALPGQSPTLPRPSNPLRVAIVGLTGLPMPSWRWRLVPGTAGRTDASCCRDEVPTVASTLLFLLVLTGPPRLRFRDPLA